MRLSELTDSKVDAMVAEMKQKVASQSKTEEPAENLNQENFQKYKEVSQFAEVSLPFQVALLLPAGK